jgi:hypothetical protein
MQEFLRPILQIMRHCKTSDARDKVFALYGLLTELGIEIDEPNYAHDDFNVPYLQFTRKIMKWQNSLDMLGEAAFLPGRGTPSWVPDWRIPYNNRPGMRGNTAGKSLPRFEIDNRKIRTFGKMLGPVISCSEQLSVSETISEISHWADIEVKQDSNGIYWKGFGPGYVQKGDILV